MACWLAVLGCAACSNETDFVQPEADNNSIVLDISSATTSVTRAGATGAEVTVSYVDVLIFDWQKHSGMILQLMNHIGYI